MREFDIDYPHSKSKRVIKENSRSIKNKIIAWSLGEEYYDGQRENGYGGFYYDGRWATIMPRIIKEYKLNHNSTVLDFGCKKGFFLHDLKQALPGIRVNGIENHPYPIEKAMESVKKDLILCPYEKLPFEDNSFDFVIAFASIYMLNFSGVLSALREIQRVCKESSYVTLGAYKTKEEKELFLEWTLLGTTILHEDEWLEVFQEIGYTGDYFFTSAKSLHLVRG
jgi:SAM-dependent methyltransferase